MKRFLLLSCMISGMAFGQAKYQKDFEEFWKTINANYAYLEKAKIDWEKVREIYSPIADTIVNDQDFIRLLEKVLNELHNGHSSLNMNLSSSNRLIPSGSDMYVEEVDGRYMITDVRPGAGAALCGLKPGMNIVGFNGREVKQQLNAFLPGFTTTHSMGMQQYAISMLFAGTHDHPRKITVLENGSLKDYYPDNFKPVLSQELLEFKIRGNKSGYIKINNSLWNNALIPEFDRAMDSLMNTESLVIDLTETPSGGNTTVARSIMGRFTDKPMPYQIHQIEERDFGTKRYWVEYVLPRGETFRGRLIILVGHWTGSMGEGIAIGFDGMKKATVIGTRMAGLLGAISGFQLQETKIGFQIPTEMLFHVDGTAREDFIPEHLTSNYDESWKKVMQLLEW